MNSRGRTRGEIRVVFGTPVDATFTNAQCINGREIATRLSGHFALTLFHSGQVDERLARRPHTRFVQLRAHGNAIRMVANFLWRQDVYFNVNCGPAESFLRPVLRVVHRPATVFQVETVLPIPDWVQAPAGYLRGMEGWLEQADVVTAVSHKAVRYLQEERGRPDAFRVPVGVDVSAFSPAEERNPRPVVLSVGSLQTRKRPGIVLDAARKFSSAEFRVIGEGPLRRDLERRIVSEGIQNVTLLGSRPNPDVLEEMRRADVFFFPSVHEGQPRVVLEAAAAGLPVVSRNDYGPEGVIHGVTGYAVASDDELFVALGELLETPSRRLEMGDAGRAHAEGFDWSRIVPVWEEIFERVYA